ncbi:hypothetical protein BDV25DRAFT_169686 [Aspergillus avenaceus]|uniref:Protein kinase domain-containing protein n=1 Tax=Aspergillus avenaceus TaxID=36643 RepID=A0A5N6TK21_ASPAV|nr:hypothetical protein BDV25DRAFT_169686 [Aspergillus avenaceus]
MAAEGVRALCERFVSRLKDNSSYNHHGIRFFRNGTVKEVLSSNRPDVRELFELMFQIHELPLDLVHGIVERTLTDLSIIFAILLFAQRRDEVPALRRLLALVLDDTNKDSALQITDGSLPISLTTATEIFPFYGDEVFKKQFQFCAVTLIKREEVMYKDYKCRCPLPYVEEKEIGQGAFGQVWKVQIERRHFQSRVGSLANTERVEYARKDFELKRERAFQEEREILDTILDQPRRHKNIMVALASLQYGDTYSLFFPLASCNLFEYLNGDLDEDRGPPSDLEEKSAIYRRGVNLTSALAFLHHEFRNKHLEVFSCYHLDLKPHNVLVFDAYTDAETWKITDFGLSRVKGRGLDGKENIELVMPFLGWAQKRAGRLQEPSTLNQRGEGTYLAPECSLPNGRVSAASDVWSLGCIFSLVMSYLDSGHNAKLSDVVIDWFGRLKHNARASRYFMEHDVVCRTLDYLQKKVFLPARDQRESSKNIEEMLTSISHLYHRKPSETLTLTKRERLLRRLSVSLGTSSDTAQYHQLPIAKGATVYKTAFAPMGNVLTFLSPEKIQVFFPDEILPALGQKQAIPNPRFILVPRGSWECVGSSSRYLCTGSFTSSFEASEGSPISINQAVRVQRPNMGSIKKIVLSPNGLLTAFALSQNLDSDTRLYLAYTQELIDASSDGNHSALSSPANSANSAASYHSSVTFYSGGNIISGDSLVGSVAQIRSLSFSNNGQYLIMISQPDPGHLLLRVWDTHFGMPCANEKIRFAVSVHSCSNYFSSCAVANKGPNLFILCQGKYLLQLNSWKWDRRVHTLPNHLVKLFVRDDDESLVLLGDNASDRRLRAYTLPIPVSGTPESKKIALSDLNSYKPALMTLS